MTSGRPWWSNPRLWLLAIVAFAAVSRLAHIQWDQNHFFHPDERMVAFTVQRLSFKPLQLDPDFFAYGTLPHLLGQGHHQRWWRWSIRMRRPTTASWSLGAVCRRSSGRLQLLLLIALGTRLYDRSVGLLAGLLLGRVRVAHSETLVL